MNLPRRYVVNEMQHAGEFATYLEILKREHVSSYLEIGAKWGGAVWQVATILPPGARIVIVDLPWGDKSTQLHLEACKADLERRGFDVRLILDDCTKPEVIEGVRKFGPFDACFIDANHTEPYVRKDWENYGSMARLVAFHDIGWIARPMPSGKLPIDVPKVWNEIKTKYRHQEIRMCERDNGIGVIWR